jgi:hypothetical protein
MTEHTYLYCTYMLYIQQLALQVDNRWKQLLHTFHQLDVHRCGRVSVTDFEGVLRMTRAAHRLGPKEVLSAIVNSITTATSVCLCS